MTENTQQFTTTLFPYEQSCPSSLKLEFKLFSTFKKDNQNGRVMSY